MDKWSEEIDRDRRYFFGAAALTIAAAQLGIAAPAYAQTTKIKVAELPKIKAGTNTKFALLKQIDASGPDPDRYVQSNFEATNALKIAMQKSGFRGREDNMKLIEALEGLEMKEGDDFPQGDKLLRKEDHQAFLREFIFDVKDGKHRLLETVAKEKTMFPPECKFAST